MDEETVENPDWMTELEGWSRYGDWTYLGLHYAEATALVRLTDADALSGVPARFMASGSAKQVLDMHRELVGDDEELMHLDRPDGTSFLVVDKVLYVISELEGGAYAVLELTDFDANNGELATIVYESNDLSKVQREFRRLTLRRAAGHAPVAGQLAPEAPLESLNAAVTGAPAREFVGRERCASCGHAFIVGTAHDC